MKNNILKENSLFLFIIVLAILPSFCVKYFNATSYAMGIFLFSIIVLLSYKYNKNLSFIKKSILLWIILFIFYLYITIFISSNLLNIKATLSLFLLLIIFITTYLIAYKINGNNIDLYITIMYTVFLFMFLGICHLIFVGGPHNVFPFFEASHYSLFVGPFFISLFILTKSKMLKLIIISWLVFAGITFPNVTILLYLFLICLLYIKINIKSMFFVIIGVIIILNLIVSNEYFYDRFFFWTHDSFGLEHLSGLVYLQGLQDVYFSLISTRGLGLGFQQLGTQPVSEAGLIIQELLKNNTGLNRYDGGFTAAKIIAELGILGIILIVLYLFLFKKSYLYLIKMKKRNHVIPSLIIAYSFIYSYSVELFIRGSGYFTPSGFFFYIAISYILIKDKIETPNNTQ